MKTKKANPAAPSPSLLLLFIIILSVIELSTGDPRSRIIQIMCEKQLEHDLTIFVHNFVLMMKNISDQMRTSGFGVAISGSGPDTNYGLVQCYGDLSVLDCVLCYAETRTVLPRCFPFTGGRIYLDGCFMQAQNCSLIEEYTGPSDYASCGNETERTPRSRRRALNTGCFMRYSDTDFLNKEPDNGSSTGSNDAIKLVKTLHDSSLNFKYATLEKATRSFDNANKLGQGGFGTVYKSWLMKERLPWRLFFNNRHKAADFYNEVNM
ncbi:Cysteine-rich receptor-like protein kinase 2 [Vitis vinifera]|uniref:Cysteine-rich receptor-like protein kinase 2 n=1 Tax=Vitis vinifera TaxID=29760 RepID=A0A438J636_VITVI|nr:Cysteine-rich receptor-like protein kinase 2 [Vitis vinifera]